MILHISNDFNHTKVHKELYAELDNLGLEQSVYIPLKNHKFKNNNHFEFKDQKSQFVYSSKLKIYHKFLFSNKISFLYTDLINKIAISEVSLVHATTLFSDGALAFKIFKDYNIPYVVAVRSTDINFFFKYRKDLLKLGKSILLNAQRVIFISEASRKQFVDIHEINDIIDVIKSKIVMFNNGIDRFWIDNKSKYFRESVNELNFLFVGDFIKRKNCLMLIEAISNVRIRENIDINLHLVGRPGNQSKKIADKVQQNDWIKFHGEIKEKEKLKAIFKKCQFFTMISHIETFGLVYIEALSQGKPVLFTKGQGIDYLFNLSIGEKVDSFDLDDIERNVLVLLSKDYSEINHIDFEDFRWENIANKYHKLYKIILDD
ncbi:glycosyltransferase [Myroides odoratimimus]|uniref:glycosyltransferase n=1 Tax=Myroides odoratimimus TaxID=76832 RepID=UPI002DBD091D|nr:glycosyltransferase [Myroides odoratimimus]MEC4028771.1 glycosyltransferase [Myroides odoratimimus]